jgi:hypothetical protein
MFYGVVVSRVDTQSDGVNGSSERQGLWQLEDRFQDFVPETFQPFTQFVV